MSLSPLTVVTGPNNSGKTSLLDLLRLLDTDDDRVLYDINLSKGDHRNRTFEDLLSDPEAGGLTIGFRSAVDFKSGSLFPDLRGLSADEDLHYEFELADDVYLVSEFDSINGNRYLASKEIYLCQKEKSSPGHLIFSETHQVEDPNDKEEKGPEKSTSENSSETQSKVDSFAERLMDKAETVEGTPVDYIRFGSPGENGVIRGDSHPEDEWSQRKKQEISLSKMHRERSKKKSLWRQTEWTFHADLWEMALQVLRKYYQLQGDSLKDFSVGNYETSWRSDPLSLMHSESEIAGRPIPPLGSQALRQMLIDLKNGGLSPPSWIPPDKEDVWLEMLQKIIAPLIEGIEESLTLGGKHIPSFRARPRRYYGPKDQLTNLLRHYRQANESRRDKVNQWLKTFEIGTDLKVEKLGPDLFEAHVERNGGRRYLADLGSGSAQLLPLILGVSGRMQGRVLVEEPEANLHPNLQAHLADLFVELASYGTQVIVETHSEYFVRRLQYLIAKGEFNPNWASVTYLDAQDLESREGPNIRQISIDEDGQLSESFGSGFFDQATDLMVDLFKYGSEN